MRDLDHALSLIDAVVGAVDVPVTVKMRLGWDEATLNAPLLARRAEQSGVRMVTIHGRTRCQFYQGKADWRAIARIKQAVSIPVVANGDVATPCDAMAILESSGADAVMIGRAHYGAPDRQAPSREPLAVVPRTRRFAWPSMSSPTMRTCCRSTASKAGCGKRANTSAGISTVMRHRQRRRRARQC